MSIVTLSWLQDDELDERSREILSLESRLRELERSDHTLQANNGILTEEYKQLEAKYTEAQVSVSMSTQQHPPPHLTLSLYYSLLSGGSKNGHHSFGGTG